MTRRKRQGKKEKKRREVYEDKGNGKIPVESKTRTLGSGRRRAGRRGGARLG